MKRLKSREPSPLVAIRFKLFSDFSSVDFGSILNSNEFSRNKTVEFSVFVRYCLSFARADPELMRVT